MSEATERVKDMLTRAGFPTQSVTEDPEPRPEGALAGDLHRDNDGFWFMFDGRQWFSLGRPSTP